MYEIAVDVPRHRVLLTMRGYFGEDEIKPFQVALTDAARTAKAGGAFFDLLVDLTESGVLAKTIASDTSSFLADVFAMGMRKTANITTDALMKLQVKRLSATDKSRCFTSREEAIAWLDSGD